MFRDGNAWCATLDGFVNLQESVAGFGDTPHAAAANLLENVKGVAPLLAGASVEHGVEVEATEDFADRGASSGCPPPSCSLLFIPLGVLEVPSDLGLLGLVIAAAVAVLGEWRRKPASVEVELRSARVLLCVLAAAVVIMGIGLIRSAVRMSERLERVERTMHPKQ